MAESAVPSTGGSSTRCRRKRFLEFDQLASRALNRQHGFSPCSVANFSFLKSPGRGKICKTSECVVLRQAAHKSNYSRGLATQRRRQPVVQKLPRRTSRARFLLCEPLRKGRHPIALHAVAG